MLTQFLNEKTIAVRQKAADKNEAIRIAGELLVKQSWISPAYIDEMIRSVDELGPYIVISPGIAFAHARPSELVERDCTSLITLEPPVCFGHKKNDPVSILFALANRETRQHLSVMRDISKMICQEDFFDAVTGAQDIEAVIAYIEQGM